MPHSLHVVLLLCVLLVLSAPPGRSSAQEPGSVRAELPALAEALHRRLLELRADAGVSAIPRTDILDQLARQRAGEIAALPEAHRHLAGPGPISAFLARQNFGEYRRVGEHLDLKKGFDDLGEAFAYTWVSSPETRALALDTAMDAVGIGLSRSEDGWVILVAVFLQESAPLQRDLRALEVEAIHLINDIRRDAGLSELRETAELTTVARTHSVAMAAEGFFDHVDREGRAPADRVARAGILYRAVAENIQFNNAEAAARVAVEQWMQSPGHRRNILTGDFRFTGLGVAVDEDGGVYFTQLFLDPPRLRPSRSQAVVQADSRTGR